ncbi:nucleotide-diphospho-sugar transferase [Mycotypha africana]|uniref:nucleotide-diphospho-sugar transferase n=1 Tax=Mycotypha africana TaxID=64632 RepID=UPI00230148B0|nr:nucleotide-diphospho-sugar transferase [Mycotypha africana]KAI8975196.1 nucleotide-diphospho-sugar transferase [Mycotypha africana]
MLSLSGLLVITYVYRHTIVASTSFYNSFIPDLEPIDIPFQQQQHQAFLSSLKYKNRYKSLSLQYNQQITEKKQVENHLYRHLDDPYDFDTEIPGDTWTELPARGVVYLLVRNEDLPKVRLTMREFLDRMKATTNVRNNTYPWVFLSAQKFTPDFKKYVSSMIPSDEFKGRRVFFGQIDLEAWSSPEWIDTTRTEEGIMKQILAQQSLKNVDSLTKKQKMRYQTGLFFYHPLFDNVEYVLRLEPGASFPCDITTDPFETMKKKNKKLGMHSFLNSSFILPAHETIHPWLFNSYNETVQYNFCHFSTAFEMVNLDFLKSEQYSKFFQYLDLVGGFFYERWSDGAIRTIAASLFLQKDNIHFFNNIGYSYANTQHCPFDNKSMDQCLCDMKQNTNLKRNSCTLSLLKHIDTQQLANIKRLVLDRLPEMIRYRKKSKTVNQ